MSTQLRAFAAVATLLVLAACGGKPAPEEPAARAGPGPGPGPGARAGSVAAAAAAAARRARTPPSPPPASRPALLDEVRVMVHFEFDKSDIRPEDRPTLDRKAAILGANCGLRLRISGHADERGSDEYNLALGTRRAASVKTYLGNKGIETFPARCGLLSVRSSRSPWATTKTPGSRTAAPSLTSSPAAPTCASREDPVPPGSAGARPGRPWGLCLQGRPAPGGGAGAAEPGREPPVRLGAGRPTRRDRRAAAAHPGFPRGREPPTSGRSVPRSQDSRAMSRTISSASSSSSFRCRR